MAKFIVTFFVASTALIFMNSFVVMILVGMLHSVVPAVPAVSYWASLLITMIFGLFNINANMKFSGR